VFDHPRNIDDDHLRALAAQGGVIQINSVYVKAEHQSPGRKEAMEAFEKKYPENRVLTRGEYLAKLAEHRQIDSRFPETDRATFADVMTNLLHAIKIAGVEHVGIGLDWDGGGGVAGLEDVADLPRITAALLAAGYSRDDVQKIWSGNVLRVLSEAERVAVN
jgi:membrane dipeptidase